MMLVEDEAGNIQNFSLMASTSSMVRKMEKRQMKVGMAFESLKRQMPAMHCVNKSSNSSITILRSVCLMYNIHYILK